MREPRFTKTPTLFGFTFSDKKCKIKGVNGIDISIDGYFSIIVYSEEQEKTYFKAPDGFAYEGIRDIIEVIENGNKPMKGMSSIFFDQKHINKDNADMFVKALNLVLDNMDNIYNLEEKVCHQTAKNKDTEFLMA